MSLENTHMLTLILIKQYFTQKCIHMGQIKTSYSRKRKTQVTEVLLGSKETSVWITHVDAWVVDRGSFSVTVKDIYAMLTILSITQVLLSHLKLFQLACNVIKSFI